MSGDSVFPVKSDSAWRKRILLIEPGAQWTDNLKFLGEPLIINTTIFNADLHHTLLFYIYL